MDPGMRPSGVDPAFHLFLLLGREMAAAYPEDRIGLIPCALNGVDIDFYLKGVVSARRHEFPIPPDNHWTGAYEWVLTRARLAQRMLEALARSK